MVKYLDDFLFVLGGGLLVYATSLWSIPGAWYVAGVLFITAGIMIGLGGRSK